MEVKHNEAGFRDSVLMLGFTIEQDAILSQFYETNKSNIGQLNGIGLNELHYHDLQWRFEVQLASGSLLQQVTPLITLDLTLKTSKEDGLEPELHHILLQTDPTNLLHLANELENALVESRSRNSRKKSEGIK